MSDQHEVMRDYTKSRATWYVNAEPIWGFELDWGARLVRFNFGRRRLTILGPYKRAVV